MIARRSFSPYGELMFEARHAHAKGELDRARILRDAATKVIERELVGEAFTPRTFIGPKLPEPGDGVVHRAAFIAKRGESPIERVHRSRL